MTEKKNASSSSSSRKNVVDKTSTTATAWDFLERGAGAIIIIVDVYTVVYW